MLRFLKAYVQSMRLYYSFVTGIAGWIGVAYYQYLAASQGPVGTSSVVRSVELPTPLGKQLVILVLLFLSWGVNQIINDYLGRDADRINAPDRPMVSGELEPKKALALSIMLLIASSVVTALYLEPVALLPLGAGVLLNVVYEYAKGHGIVGNLVFGVMISMCGLFGLCASGPLGVYLTKSRLSVLALLVVMNGVMTFYTYFKDVEGDRAAGKHTLIVMYGVATSRWLAILSAFLPSLLFALLYFGLGAIEIRLNRTFVLLGALTVFLELWTGVLYFKHPVGEQAYRSLEVNFRAAACGQAALIALFNPELGATLFLFTYVLVGFLFGMHGNAKA
jgi:geranylgeranylglycerol-phosphate geranylgeranyltransferase